MSNVNIDIDVLTHALSQAMKVAIEAAVIKPVKKNKIRGRPKKISQSTTNVPEHISTRTKKESTEIITVDENVEEIINEPLSKNLNKPTHGYIAQAKNNNRVGGVGTVSASEVVTENRGKMKFIDVQNVGDKIPSTKYPEPSQRRPEKKKLSFMCDRCRCQFEMYPSEIPQAFMKEKIPTGGEDKPRVYCNDCTGIGK